MVASMVSQQIFGESAGFERYSTMGIVRGERLIGGVVFHDWQEKYGTVQISAAGMHGRWLTRPVINAVFHFVFDLLGAKVANANSPADNPPSVTMNRGIFANEAVVQHMFGPGVSGHVFTMTEIEWRNSRLYKGDVP